MLISIQFLFVAYSIVCYLSLFGITNFLCKLEANTEKGTTHILYLNKKEKKIEKQNFEH